MSLCLTIRGEFWAWKEQRAFLPYRTTDGETYYTFEDIKRWKRFAKWLEEGGNNADCLLAWGAANFKEVYAFLKVLETYLRNEIEKEKGSMK